MEHLLNELESVQENPFTADFGIQPNFFAGHESLHRSLLEGLTIGPSDNRFTSILLGPRGSGKTVTLHRLQNITEKSGWVILPIDSTDLGIENRLNKMISWAHDHYENMPNKTTEIEIQKETAGFKFLGMEWQREAVRKLSPKWDLRRKLSTLAEHAANSNKGVLLTIDELQNCNRKEIRRLVTDIQHITKGQELPLAFIGAGLSDMHHTLFTDKKITFFQRCNRFSMPLLSYTDVMQCLLKTVLQSGGEFQGDALELLTDISGVLPYRMQVAGHNAWKVAVAPDQPITEKAVKISANITNSLMHDHIALPTWHSLNTSEQDFLRALAKSGGTTTPDKIIEQTQISPLILSRTEKHLMNTGCVQVTNDGLLKLSNLITINDMSEITKNENRYLEAKNVRHRIHSTATKQKCATYMPRVKAKCILPRDHKGGHRSK